MFGHLKAEDFTNLIEGAALAENRLDHLRSCVRCGETLKAVQGVRQQVAEMQMADGESIPEPDWSEFRSDVRSALLSRSVKRENARGSWLGGGAWRPAMAWSLSLMFVLGLGAGVLLWNEQIAEAPTQIASAEEALTEMQALDVATSMTQTDVFDDLLRLDESEAASLLLLLEDIAREGVSQQ